MNKILYILGIGILLSACSTKTKQLTETASTPVDIHAFRATAPSPAEARPIQIGDYEQFVVKNGLKVIVVENHKIPRVSYSLSLLTKPFMEGDKMGYSQIAGDLIGRGTSNRSKAQIDEEVDFVGASLSAYASGMYGSSLTKHQQVMLDVYTDILYNANFPQEELDKIVTQMLNGLEQSKNSPESMASNISSVVNYTTDHPYGEVMTEATVKNVTVDDCKAYYKEQFRPDNAILTIVGDINIDEAKKMVDKYFGSWKNPNTPMSAETIKDVEMKKSTEVAFAHKDGAVQSYVQVTYPINYPKGSPDAAKVSVMNTILGGGGFMGRLMQNLREDKAYTYGARSSLSSDEYVGSFTAYASVRNEVTDSAVVQFLYELERMVKEQVTEEDLMMAKSVIAGSFARSMESPQTIANFAYSTIRYNLPEDYYATYLQRLDAVTVADVQAMAAKYLRPEAANIVVVGEKDEVAPKLLKFDSDGKIDFYDAFGNKVEMSDEAAPADMDGKQVIKKYIEAIGGEATLKAVSTIKMVAGMDLMGQQLEMTIMRKAPNMFYQKLGNESMTMQEQIFDGVKAKLGGMGGSQMVTEGEELEAIKKEAKFFGELDYLTDAYTLDLKGIEKVNDVDSYKLLVTDADGEKQTLFFAVDSGLMLKKVSTESARGQTVTVSTEFSEYESFEGIKFPKKISITGGAPFPINFEFKTVEINKEISSDIFKID